MIWKIGNDGEVETDTDGEPISEKNGVPYWQEVTYLWGWDGEPGNGIGGYIRTKKYGAQTYYEGEYWALTAAEAGVKWWYMTKLNRKVPAGWYMTGWNQDDWIYGETFTTNILFASFSIDTD